MLEYLGELINADAAIVRRGRHCTLDFLVEVGDTPHLISTRQGRIEAVETGVGLMRPWRFAIRADDRVGEDLVVLADDGVARDRDVVVDAGAIADAAMGSHVAEGAQLHASADFGRGMNVGVFVTKG